jgi:guanosine-3',5'-bis(diphosphate) 3'-pyrophosphohydrolase
MTNSSDTQYRQLLEAVSFTARAHHGQFRKDRVTPYASHPFRVCLIVRDIFGFDDPRMLITALLHDTLEDTTTDFDDLEARYGAEIAAWVAYLSKDKRLPEVMRERAYIERLKEAPWQVQVCKLADVFDNLMDTAHLPAEKQAQTLKRSEQYFAELSAHAAPEMKKPIELVRKLMGDVKAKPS